MLRFRRILSATPRNGNGGNLLGREEKLSPVIPLYNPSRRTSARFLDVYELASKAAIERERARLKDEITRGYFQDMKEMETHHGKVSKANKIVFPATSAIKFPTLEVRRTDGSILKLPLSFNENDVNVSDKGSITTPPTSKSNDTNVSTSDTAKVSLICLSFRASSAPMVDSWTSPFVKTFGHSSDIQLYKVSFIDYWLLSLSLVRKLMLRFALAPTAAEKNDAMQRQIVYHFGDHYDFRKELNIINLLTGYIFLLDKDGRIRWQGSGVAAEDELLSLMSCTSVLLSEQ